MASRTALAAPSLWQAVITGFGIALLAGGFGAARGLAPWRKLAGRVPPRTRSVILGMVAALAMLAAFGAVLAAASLAIHLGSYKAAVSALNPGIGGSALLLLASLSYLPNSVIWAIAYMLGPGFAFGVGTAVSPSGLGARGGARPSRCWPRCRSASGPRSRPGSASSSSCCRTWRARWPG